MMWYSLWKYKSHCMTKAHGWHKTSLFLFHKCPFWLTLVLFQPTFWRVPASYAQWTHQLKMQLTPNKLQKRCLSSCDINGNIPIPPIFYLNQPCVQFLLRAPTLQTGQLLRGWRTISTRLICITEHNLKSFSCFCAFTTARAPDTSLIFCNAELSYLWSSRLDHSHHVFVTTSCCGLKMDLFTPLMSARYFVGRGEQKSYA